MPIEFLEDQPKSKIEFVDDPQMNPSQEDLLSMAESYGDINIPEAKPQIDVDVMGGVKGRIAAAGMGGYDLATMGASDEALALALSKSENVPYEQALEGVRATQQAYRQEYPASYIGGQVVGGMAAAAGAVPQAVKKGIANVSKRGFLQATGAGAGLGGISGGLYAFGTGEGGAQQRLEEVPAGAGIGAAGGLAGVGISRGLEAAARPITSIAQRAANAFRKKPVQPISTPKQALPISGEEAAQKLSEISQKGKATTMLKGAQTQDVALMRSEEMARQGLLGNEMETLVRQADKEFMNSVKRTMQSLAGEGTEETAQDTFVKSMRVVKNRFDAEKKLQNRLMTARNNAIAKTKVYRDYTKETLGTSLDELKKSPDFKVALMRKENAPIADDFKIINKILNGKNINAVEMSYMGSWRSGLNSYKPGTQQGALAKKMANVYDDWLDNNLKMAIKEGDTELAEKIFKANSKYAEFKSKYGTNTYKGQKKVIENIINQDEMTPRAMVNTVFGKSMDGKDYTEQYVKRLVEAMPEGAKREGVKEGFRAGLFQKAFEESYDSVNDSINIGKLRNNLIKMEKNDAYKTILKTPDHDSVVRGLIEDLGKYQRATQDRTVVNLSGTTPMAARIIQGFGSLPIINKLTIARGSAEALAEAAKTGARATNKKQVEKSLAEFYKAVSPEIDNQIKFNFGGVDALTGGAQAVSIMESE